MSELEQIKQLKEKALTELSLVKTGESLEAWRVAHLGRKSFLTQALRNLANLPVEERKAVGAFTNEVKNVLAEACEGKKQALSEQAESASPALRGIDVTLPGRGKVIGRLHPITAVIEEISDIFSSMGFGVVEGPEVESDYYNFDALNIPKEHPARDTMDTFWLEDRKDKNGNPLLLRTHTSPMQIRYMEKNPPPIRIVVPGKVYRYEATDATHLPMFHQIEGLAVDENITMADLKGVLYEFARRFFEEDRKVRFRCDFFPFVEPGVEMAINCNSCSGGKCRVCGGSGWLEVLGAGMVHPKVLEYGGIDSKKYTGFAFGIGIERLVMLKHGITDIRLFYNSDLRFLRQF